jgi:hypothetical protein
MKPHALSIVVAALAVAACSNATEPDNAYIRGYVTFRDSIGIGARDVNTGTYARYYPRILVEEDPSDPVSRGTTNKIRVSWKPGIELKTRSGINLKPSDVVVGQLVSVWIEPIVLESYPAQGGATRIIVESN